MSNNRRTTSVFRILSKMIECLKGEKEKEGEVSIEQTQSLQNESKQETNININIERNNE